jgi:hypothetical protein
MTDATLSAEDASFARALARLYLQLLDLNAWPPRDVECSLCEDGKTVTLLAADGSGHFVVSGFQLDDATDEDAFFPQSQRYVEWIENGVELQHE